MSEELGGSNTKGLKRRAAAGVRWLGLASVTRAALMLARLSVLARLLSPEDFGLMSLVMVVLGFAQAYIDAGLSTSLIQRQEQDPDRLATLFWINVLLGAAAFGVVSLLRGPIALALNQASLAGLLPVAAFQLPIAAFGLQYGALLRREFEFKSTALLQVFVDIVNVVTAVILAGMGYGVWSLIISALLGAVVNTVGLFIMGSRRWALRFRFRPKEVTLHLRFGVYELGKLSVTYLASNADTLLIGSLIGTEALGLYNVSMRLTQLPRKYISPVIARVALSVFARQQADVARMRKALLTIQRLLGHVSAPLTLGLLLTAPVLVPLISGPQWVGAVPLVRWLCVPMLFAFVAGPLQVARVALGQFRFDFHWSWASGVVLAGAMWAAIGYGIGTVVVARALVASIISIVLLCMMMRLVGIRMSEFLSNLARPAVAVIIMSIVVQLAMIVTEQMASWQRALIAVGLGGAVYTATAMALDREFLLSNLSALIGLRTKEK